MMIKRTLILVLFFLLSTALLLGNNILIKDINKQFDVGKNIVSCMFQDSTGFLWFGMANGLYKFDSNTFTYFNLGENRMDGFPTSDVRSIIEYAPGVLLVGTFDKGLLGYNSDIERHFAVHCDASIDLSSLSIRTLYLDRSGTIWVGSTDGLIQLRPKETGGNEFQLINRFHPDNTSLISNEVVDIMQNPDGTVWFLTMSDIGYHKPIIKETRTYATYGANSSFTFIDNDRILIGCFDAGLKLFSTKHLAFEDIDYSYYFEELKVRYVYSDRNSNIWVSISNAGLVLVEPDHEAKNSRITEISNKNPLYSDLNSNVIYYIAESDDGALWVCGENGLNLIHLKDNAFKSYSYKPARGIDLPLEVRALLDSGEGFLWVGTVGDGLKQFHIESQKFVDVPLIYQGRQIREAIQTIIRDYKGNLWIGTEGEGVIKLMPDWVRGSGRENTFNFRIHPPVPVLGRTLLNNYIMCLLEDSNRNIWIGTWYGLSLIESAELQKPNSNEVIIKTFFNDPDDSLSISSNIIMNLKEDASGNIWVGTYGGLNRVKRMNGDYGFENHYASTHSIPLTEKKILSILQASNGRLWFSTQDGGIAYLEPELGLFYEYNSSNGFHNNIVNSIAEDSSGTLWLGTNNGLCRFNPSNFTYKFFRNEDGLATESFSFNASCRVGSSIFFGQDKGLVEFYPNEVVQSIIQPRLVFTDLKLFNQAVDFSRKDSPLHKHISKVNSITLNHKQNYITIAFAALNYKQHDEVQYSCIMEGLEPAWANLGNDSKITYTNLRPGDYYFRVRASSAGPLNNTDEITLHIKIKPPVWRTHWAYMLYFVLILFTGLQIRNGIVSKERKRHALALERMNARRTHELDLMKLQFYTNISHEFRTPLTLISGPLESLISNDYLPEKAQSYYQLMLKNVHRLRRLIDQLLDLRKIEEGYSKIEWMQGDIIEFAQRVFSSFEHYAEKRGISYSFKTSCPHIHTFFDADKMEKILFNLISNAFKYTPNQGSIIVRLEERSPTGVPFSDLSDRVFAVHITDSGSGIPKGQIESIFNPFQRVSENKPIGSGTTGIGLSLTKELVGLLKGYISVDSQVGKGSTFSVFLPILKDNPSGITDESDQEGFIDHPQSELVTDVSGCGENGPETGNETSADQPLVLVVEDNSDLRGFLKDKLQGCYNVLEASNGQEGYDIAAEEIPDLVLSDIIMPEMDGVELCSRLKSDVRTSHIPVVLLTAKSSEETILSSYEIGADDYITKPFSVALLNSRVKNLIEQRSKLRKLFGQENNFDFSEIATNELDSKFIDKLNGIIEKNIDNSELTPTSLASEMCMSKMQLYRKVAALTDQTVNTYIRILRMNKAAKLLLTTDMQIAEVAVCVGYSEPSNFTKSFSKQFNQTPSQFVQANRKK